MAELDINDIVQPSAALRTSQRDQFVGRENLIAEALAGIASEGTALCILGERGIGKTSLAWRINEYLTGDRSWFKDKIDLKVKIPQCDVIWLEVLRAHESILGVILDLISDRGRASRWTEFTIGNEISDYFSTQRSDSIKKLLESTLMRRFGEALDSEEQGGPRKREAKERPLSELNKHQSKEVIDTFRHAIESISKKRGKQIFFIFDEIDRLPDKTGLGEFIKSGTLGRYCFVGVADNIDELIIADLSADHPSAERKVFPVLVGRLSQDQVFEFVERCETKINAIGLSFSADFKKLVYHYCDGFPYIMQRLCRDSLLRATQEISVKIPDPRRKKHKSEDEKFQIIDHGHFYAALDGFLNPNFDGGRRYEKLQKSINNAGKEAALFLMADQMSGWVPVELIREKLGSAYGLGSNLIEMGKDGLIIKGRDETGIESVRFFDPKLRAIVLRIKDRRKRLYKKKRKGS